MQKQYDTATMLSDREPMMAALEIIEKVLGDVIGVEITKRGLEKSLNSKDSSSDIQNAYTSCLRQDSKNDSRKQEAALEHRQRNLRLTNGSLKSAGDPIQFEKGNLNERKRIIMGTRSYLTPLFSKAVLREMYAIKDGQKLNHDAATSAASTSPVHLEECTTRVPPDDLLTETIGTVPPHSSANTNDVESYCNKDSKQLDSMDWKGIGYTAEKKDSHIKNFLRSLKKLLCCCVKVDKC